MDGTAASPLFSGSRCQRRRPSWPPASSQETISVALRGSHSQRCPSATWTAYQSPLGDPDQEGTEALTNTPIRIGHRGFVEAHHAEPSRGPRSRRKPSMQCAYPGGRGGIRNH
ncbi:MAG: hypothetical protein QOD10_774 [Mycobacterium sp.]|nr:hypothetical protein [Mycobacterium sp.]